MRGFSVAVVVVFVLNCASSHTAVETDTTAIHPADVRGCYVTYNPTSGDFLYEPFLKVADKSSTSETGEPEVWGYRVWNLEAADADGRTRVVNIAASRFVPADGKAHERPAGSVSRYLKCDMFTNWTTAPHAEVR
jgi:hypothetical protein